MKNKINELSKNDCFSTLMIAIFLLLIFLLIRHDFITVLLTIAIIATLLDIALVSLSSKEFKSENLPGKLSIILNKLINDAGITIIFFILGLMAK